MDELEFSKFIFWSAPVSGDRLVVMGRKTSMNTKNRFSTLEGRPLCGVERLTSESSVRYSSKIGIGLLRTAKVKLVVNLANL